MMNVLGLSLVLTSLAAAGVFSPTPEKPAAASTIIKDGHRVIVVEYDQDGHQNTKISISSPEPQQQIMESYSSSSLGGGGGGGILNNAKDKIKEAASVLPNMGQGISSSQHQQKQQESVAFLHAPKELICDAYGRCKHKIAGAMGIAKDKISEAAQEVIDKEKEMIGSKRETAREVGNSVADAVGKAKDKANEYTHESLEKVKDTGQILKEHVVRNVSETRDSLRNMKDNLKRGATNLGRSMMESLQSLSGVANLVGFATAYGMCVWVTFISSYVLSRAMPRQQFAVVQSKIYPVYFRAMAYAIAFSLLGHLLAQRRTWIQMLSPEILQACNLLASLFTVFLNSLYLEPRATKLMFERMKMEKEEGRGREDMTTAERSRTLTEEEEQQHQHQHHPKDSTTTASGTPTASSPGKGSDHRYNAVRSRIMKLNDRLKKLNSYSSVLNILNLMSLTWHLVYLVQRLNQTC